MQYNFEEIISREGTKSVKYDLRQKLFGATDIIPLWVADMDFRSPLEIEQAICKRAKHPIYGYTLQNDQFFGAAKRWLKKRHQWEVSTKSMVFSPGVVPALYMIIHSFSQPGDKIIVQTPVYHPFYDVIKGNGREILTNPMQLQNGKYEIDFKDLELKIDKKTKILLFCNPHNPGGRMWDKEELERLGNICLKNNILIISDEIHMDLSLFGKPHIPIASISEELAQKSFTCFSPGKTFNIAGLNSAIVSIPNPDLRKKFFRAMEASHLFIGNTFGTEALIAAYKHGKEWLDQLLPYLKENAEFVCNYFEKHIPEIKAMKPEATFLIWLDCRGLQMDDDQLSEFMIKQAKVGLHRGIQFGEEGRQFMRLNIGCPRPILQQALQQITKAVKEIEI
ncbi:MalY/PatB family protein [Xanthovirga aplysinae]|uniref:MalY/PatB family protein n=1 Tax=Xanthovirga aplysinae TaxID=2529853 RepID=UPI0012BC48F1|nr:PatB family C-S lyase [Xanthovirga aplysinae]MTI33223.1 putative C-S lyase [Xanthovirga aplysinae]